MGGLVVSALVNAGISFFAPRDRSQGLRSAGLTLGLTVGSYILNKLLDNTDTAQEQKDSEKEIRSAVVPARYIVGTAKVSGVLVRSFERYYAALADTDKIEPNIPSDQAIQYKALALSELGIEDVLGVFVDGKKMPFALSNDTITPDYTEFNDRIDEIEAEQKILATADAQIRNRLDSPEAVRWHDLEREKQELIKDRDSGRWIYRAGLSRDNLLKISLDPINNVVMYLDRNLSDTLSVADTRSGELLSSIFPGWGQKTTLQNLAWVWVELRAVKPIPSDEDGIFVYPAPAWSNNNINVQFIVKGAIDGTYTENPAIVARWYLKGICGFTDDDLDLPSVNDAISVCEESITIPAVTLDSNNDILNPVLASLFPDAVDENRNIVPANLPSATVQSSALANWNRKFAGADNAEKRYQCHGVITSNMLLNPTVFLQQLGFAMGGWIVSVGSKFKFIAGAASAPVGTFTDEDLAGVISENLGPLYERRFNAIKGSVAQLKTEDYTRYTIGTIINSSLASSEGYREENLGTLAFQNSEVAARRLLTKYRRRNHPNLRRLGFSLNAGENFKNYNVTAGDRVNLNLESESIVGVYRIISIALNPNGTVNIECIEEPDEVWDDDFDPDLEILLGERISEDTGIDERIDNVLNTVEYDGVESTEDEVLGSIFRINNIRAIRGDASSVLVYNINDEDWKVVDVRDEGDPIITQDSISKFYTVSSKIKGRTEFISFAVRTNEKFVRGIVDPNDPDTLNIEFTYHDIVSFSVGGGLENVYNVLFDDASPFSISVLTSTIRAIRITNARATNNADLVYKLGTNNWVKVAPTTTTSPGVAAVIEENPDGSFNMAFVLANERYVTLAARTGEGNADSPYVYHDTKIINLELQPEDVNVLVSTPPTDDDAGLKGRLFLLGEGTQNDES